MSLVTKAVIVTALATALAAVMVTLLRG